MLHPLAQSPHSPCSKVGLGWEFWLLSMLLASGISAWSVRPRGCSLTSVIRMLWRTRACHPLTTGNLQHALHRSLFPYPPNCATSMRESQISHLLWQHKDNSTSQNTTAGSTDGRSLRGRQTWPHAGRQIIEVCGPNPTPPPPRVPRELRAQPRPITKVETKCIFSADILISDALQPNHPNPRV